MDPVIGSDGITYERAAIEAWFAAGHNTSPLTRAPMTSRSLVPNIALRTLIQEATTRVTTPAPPAADPVDVNPIIIPPPTLTVEPLADGRRLLVTLSTSATTPTLPTLFIDVLDISGSMDSPAADPSRNTSDAAAFSRADLVRHSVATQIELLRPQDSLALVLFDNAATVALPPTEMTAHGRIAAKSCLPQIAPRGGTNIWSGLQKALTLAEATPTSNNIAILLQTDGESDPSMNPPRGIPDTFRAWLDAHPAVAKRVTVHTVGYGFGQTLDTPLLRRLAGIGRGTVNYIPDGSMVGTVFIHLMANLMSVSHCGLSLQIPDDGIVHPVGFLQAGQTRQFLLTSAANEVHLTGAAGPLTHGIVDVDTTVSATVTAARDFLIQVIHDALTAAESTPSLLVTFDCVITTLRTDYGLPDDHPFLTDLLHPDPAKGQIAKAFATADCFTRWGRHYIPCVLSSLNNEWAINFKDTISTQLFGTPVTRNLIDRGDAIFTAIPAPTPSAAAYSGYGGPRSVVASMASVHSAAGPCFLPASCVMMEGGVEKRCDEIRPGDIDASGYRIRCVIKTLVPYTDVVRLENRDSRPADAPPLVDSGGFTLWHPVFHAGAWRHPADLGTVERVVTDAIYNFILDWPTGYSRHEVDEERPGTLLINGIMTCTLCHGMTGPVIGHPYFGRREDGKRNILDDLTTDPGWATGYITWQNVQVSTDPTTGWIAGMTSREVPLPTATP